MTEKLCEKKYCYDCCENGRKENYDRGERYVQKIIHGLAEASGFYDP